MSLKIVIVEDDAIVATYLADAVAEFGCEVVGQAASGLEAIEMCGRTQADCAVVDLRLRGSMSGHDLVLTLRERFDLPALIVSGALDEAVRSALAPARPLGYLQKPVLPTQIEHALRQLRPRSDL